MAAVLTPEEVKDMHDRIRALMDGTSDGHILELEPVMRDIQENNPLVYEELKPLWLARLKTAKGSAMKKRGKKKHPDASKPWILEASVATQAEVDELKRLVRKRPVVWGGGGEWFYDIGWGYASERTATNAAQRLHDNGITSLRIYGPSGVHDFRPSS